MVAAVGALSLSVGIVAGIDGHLVGIVLALGGALLLAWSLRAGR